MVVAFISNLFTWKEDQAIAGIDSIWKLITTEVEVKNWLGKFGALTALKFENQWFGICAFVFPFLFVLAGIRIIWEVNLLPVGKTLRYSLFATIWISTFLGYIFHNNSSLLMLAGGYGYRMSQSLNAVIGFIGTGTLLVFSFVGFLVAAFNIPLKRKMEESLSPVSDAINEVVAVDEPIKVNKPKKESMAGVVELELGHEEEEELEEEDDELEEEGDFINLDEEEEEI